MERINNQVSQTSNIPESEKIVKPKIEVSDKVTEIGDSQEIDLEEILGHGKEAEEDEVWDVDKRTGEIITEKIGFMTKSYYENLEQKGEAPSEAIDAVNIAKTARQILKDVGKEEGSKVVADDKDYRISLEKGKRDDGILKVTSKEKDKDIVVATKMAISFNYEDKDLRRFEEYSQQLTQDKNQEIER